jgi:hypothetical protein
MLVNNIYRIVVPSGFYGWNDSISYYSLMKFTVRNYHLHSVPIVHMSKMTCHVHYIAVIMMCISLYHVVSYRIVLYNHCLVSLDQLTILVGTHLFSPAHHPSTIFNFIFYCLFILFYILCAMQEGLNSIMRI